MAAKDETLSKLNREKKQLQQKTDSASDELVSSGGKVAHLTDVKNKLEHTLDDGEKEKKVKYSVEKERRKLKMCQGSVSGNQLKFQESK